MSSAIESDTDIETRLTAERGALPKLTPAEELDFLAEERRQSLRPRTQGRQVGRGESTGGGKGGMQEANPMPTKKKRGRGGWNRK